MNNKKILIVEDEYSIAEVLIAYCEKEGYITHHINTGLGVIEYVKENKVNLILLDLMLPEIDGINICKRIRVFSQTPIIMVTAKSEEIDRLLGLGLGADDYICKPFSPKEVIARIKAVLRRTGQHETPIIKEFGFIVESDKYIATLNDKLIDFTPIEFKIFELFITNIGRVFTRDDILNRAYQDTKDISDRNIDTHIKNIRKKINLISANSNPISSVYGVGYKFETP